MGCDDATLVTADDKASGLDVAKALAAVVKEAKPDVVLCGKQASDDDQGLVGPALAEALGWPHVGDAHEDRAAAATASSSGARSRAATRSGPRRSRSSVWSTRARRSRATRACRGS